MSIKGDHNGELVFDESQVMDGLAFLESVFVDSEEDADVSNE